MQEGHQPSRTVPLILDVDTGIDDSLALLYLMGSPEAEILGITCTSGNVPAKQVTINNLAWLELCNHAEVEVAVGAEVPLVQPLITAEDTHGPQGLGHAQLPPPTREVSDRHATAVWLEHVRNRPGEVTGLVTGPLTNLALAIQLEPELPGLLGNLVIMGGAFNHAGNTTPTTEWNIAVDPEAAKVVFDAFGNHSRAPKPMICALDVTEKIEMKPRHVAALAAAAGCEEAEWLSPDDPAGTRSKASNPIIRHLSDAIRFYMEFHEAHGQGYLSHMHDPFAAAVALDPGFVKHRPATVDIELAGHLTRAQTVADWSGMWGRESNALIVTDADPEDFFNRAIQRIGNLARKVAASSGDPGA